MAIRTFVLRLHRLTRESVSENQSQDLRKPTISGLLGFRPRYVIPLAPAMWGDDVIL